MRIGLFATCHGDTVLPRRVSLLYKDYADERGYEAYAESEQFTRYGLGEGIPLLKSRERGLYTPLDGSTSPPDRDR